VGALAVGIPLTDELSRVADSATGRPLLLTTPGQGGAIEVLLRSTSDTGTLDAAVTGEGKDTVKSAFDSRSVSAAKAGGLIVAAAPLEALGSGKSAVLVVGAPLTLFPGANTLALPVLGVMLLGIVLVVVGGFLLGGYIMRPISTLEEGLLAVLNGQTDRRIELEHAELGGLAFRINQLLNQFMGIEEDTTDDEGRVSRAPTAQSFASMEAEAAAVDPATAAALAQEPAAQYYARIYAEYIGAKRALGEAVDHITEQAFVARVQGMEQDAAQKQGRPVRFQIQSRGNEVVFQPVPLG
jgi:methyl-accepting chemotaxis protein